MTEEEIKRVTNKYNAERSNFSFPTISASYEGVKSILNMHPSWKELDEEKLVFKIAVYLNDLAFGWN